MPSKLFYGLADFSNILLRWILKTGEWLVAQTPLVLKPHGRLAKSVFRTGFDHLHRLLLTLEQSADDVFQVLQFLSWT